MRAKEIMLEVKVAKGLKTDYKLAQELGITTARVSDYMKGKRAPDAYTLTKAAIILKRDPIELIAEVEAETEKNVEKRNFWKDFILHAGKKAALGMLALIFTVSLLAGAPNVKTSSGFFRRRYFA